ncbi:MAG: CHRD domain-containing protein [Gammaproteobacteria bacterium]|nr:MAG: CHRD domain-containing protein [Gammaproteobacteria bacterium]
MKHTSRLLSRALVMILAPLLVLTACLDSNNNSGGVVQFPSNILPAINPAFDSIDEVAVSSDPGGPYDSVLKYTYDPETETITSNIRADSEGGYVRITGMATVTGRQSSYTVYTYIVPGGEVAANELTSAAVGLVASGDAADFEEALGMVEQTFGLPAGSVAEPLPAAERSAEFTSILAAAAPAFEAGADPAFDVTDFTTADLEDGQAAYLDCIVLGGLAWDSWHKTGAGGSGLLPTSETDADYTRCKACHGWDQQGTDGGYVFRSRTAGRANAGYQDPNNCDLPAADPDTCTRSRNISTDATFGSGSAIEIPAGGRTWAEGSAVFDMVDPDWGDGAVLGNRHPDLGPANTEGPTAQQLSCLTAFLNAPEARADQVYSAIETVPADGQPAIYTPVATADAPAGETYYAGTCQGCHGDPSNDGIPDVGGLIAYLNQDGKFSEFMHKVHWGIPDTIMSRAAMGNPTAADVANLVAYLQAVPFTELSAAQVVPPVAGITARGSGTYTLTESGLEYLITVDTANLSGPITAAHFHNARVGVNGDVVRTINFIDGQASGIWTSTDDEPLTPELTEALLAGNVYVNVHTAANPLGEIRGQVQVVQGGGNQPPVAAITVDPDTSVAPDTLVTLDGSGSSDPDNGPSPLSYSWTLTVPAGSMATLSDPAAVSPTFTADVEGSYLVSLTVNDGLAEDTAEVTVTVSTGGGSFDAGMVKYDADCSGCHDAGIHDNDGGFAGDIAGTGSLLVNDLGTLNPLMNGILLTDQEILDLQAFLDDPSIQP